MSVVYTRNVVDLAGVVVGEVDLKSVPSPDLGLTELWVTLFPQEVDARVDKVFNGRDIEDCLQQLWKFAETHDVIIAINRFRENAVATGESRSLSNGLHCYLIDGVKPAGTHSVVEAFGRAPARLVVVRSANERYVAAASFLGSFPFPGRSRVPARLVRVAASRLQPPASRRLSR